MEPWPDLIALRIESDAVIPAIVCWLVQQGVQIHGSTPPQISGGCLLGSDGGGRAARVATRNVITVAHLTLVEARRRRIVLAGAVCAVVFLVVFSDAVVFAAREMAPDASLSFVERQGTLTMIMLVGFMCGGWGVTVLTLLYAIRAFRRRAL